MLGLGYGAGPMFFSPLSEIPRIGRNLPYVVSFALYCITSVPPALSPTAIGFYWLRFLQGFFGSPCLATGGASIADIYAPHVLPHAMTTLVLCIFCAPSIGILISGFAIPVLGWRFSMWEVLIALKEQVRRLECTRDTPHETPNHLLDLLEQYINSIHFLLDFPGQSEDIHVPCPGILIGLSRRLNPIRR